MAEAYPYQPDDVCCCKTSPCFVDSIAEVSITHPRIQTYPCATLHTTARRD